MANQAKVHWMISVLLVIGAWLSALFLLGTSYLIGGGLLDPLYLGGFFMIAAAALAWGVRRADKPAALAVFLSQVELAFSLCGKTLFCLALIVRWKLEFGSAFAVVAVTAALSYPVLRQTADRAVTVCAALCMGIAWPVLTVSSFPAVLLETASVVLFMGAYVLLARGKENEKALAWALLGACVFASSIWLSETMNPYWNPLAKTASYWSVFNGLLLGAALSLVYAWHSKGKANGWLVLLLLLLCVLGNLGTVMGLALLVLGFAQKRLPLKIIGAWVMYNSLVWLYYNMQHTLLVKSYYLGAAGLALLGAYMWLKKGEAHAE